jgi:uncharacterized protein YqgC (DUF456 family)
MKIFMKRALQASFGTFLIIFGLFGLIAPIIPGIPFILLGVVLCLRDTKYDREIEIKQKIKYYISIINLKSKITWCKKLLFKPE